ncbi:MAG TPA: hypothetical protein VHY36_17140 [Steroidobacteraceae bacterium]|nr:hypothetical protein [Steroidobacteraceae bacterium]
MQNTPEISALAHNTRNIYIAIAALTLVVGLGPSGLKMPAYLGVMGLVAWLLFLSINGKTAREIPVKTICGVVSDVTPFPTAQTFTISGYPNSGLVEGAIRFTVGLHVVYMKSLAQPAVGHAVVVAVIPNEAKDGPFAGVPFEALMLRDDTRRDPEGRYLTIPDAHMKVPTGTRLWLAAALSVLLIGFLFPIYFVVVVKRSYDIKFGWERALAEARRILASGDMTSAEAMVSGLLA